MVGDISLSAASDIAAPIIALFLKLKAIRGSLPGRS
jgi:hypothetical protein